MQSFKLKILAKDWFFISILGAFFGFFLASFFYYLNTNLHALSTLLFGVCSAVFIAIFSAGFINASNRFLLPKLSQKLWQGVSFVFSLTAGGLGFYCAYKLFLVFETPIAHTLSPFILQLCLSVGMLTFLIGLILHFFISMKYKNESILHEVTQTRLKALENELNPHFLFNALNSISELVHLDAHKAEEMVLNFSKILRNALNDQSLVSLECELEMVQTYVEVENVRFNNKIFLHFHKQESLTLSIPKFSIQLLVENAIKHGFYGEELHINIHTSAKEILVTNNGKIEHNLHFGTGLTNLKKRLQLLNVGNLDYTYTKEKMIFSINLKRAQA